MTDNLSGCAAHCMESVHVAVGVVVNEGGNVLICRRPAHVPQGGLWEFPGGKVEPGENARTALTRELHEELGITPRSAHPLLRVHHAYPDQRVLLDVWRVTAFAGHPHGREGQPMAWVHREALVSREFPAANRPIISAVRLPSLYLITPEPGRDIERFLGRLEDSLAGGVRLVQLRAKQLDVTRFNALATAAQTLCHQHGARLLLNTSLEWASALHADGVHLPARRLLQLNERPVNSEQWVAASCHNPQELQHACRLGLDFAVLSPVLPTTSHPTAASLGWPAFQRLVEEATLPVFALGGMQLHHLETAWRHGAQGIAAMSALWANR
jgi:8-oxo-dGTP diphosphatase